MTRVFGVLFMCLLLQPAFARDDGRWASSPLKDWFNSLSSPGGGPCCSYADGVSIDDVDWEMKGDHYRVRLDGVWYDVPDANIVQGKNRLGRAIVWPIKDEVGNVKIRCFMRGAMS